MHPTKTAPVLLTGMHRSGSSWIGEILSLSPSACLIHEPFNPLKDHPGACATRFSRWYTYINDHNADDYFRPIDNMLRLRYRLAAQMRHAPSPKQALSATKKSIKWTLHRLRSDAPVLKDPFAFFSADWLCRSFGARVVILVRHPAAVASSIKRYQFDFPFADLAAQPLLMRDILPDYAAQIAEFAAQPHDYVDQAALLWACIYGSALKLREQHPDWLVLRYEDVAQNPVASIRGLCEHSGLDFTPRMERFIGQSSDASNPAEAPLSAGHRGVFRSSAASLNNWQQRLTVQEIERVRQQVEPVARYYYEDADWLMQNGEPEVMRM